MRLDQVKSTAAIFCASLYFLFSSTINLSASPDYKNIPKYLEALKIESSEGKILEYNQQIHWAVVGADLSDQNVLKEFVPLIDGILSAMDSQLDRPYLTGQSMWLSSAVDYYEQQKGVALVTAPLEIWTMDQSESQNNLKIFAFPNKIIVRRNEESILLAQMGNIHEAIIAFDGKYAYFYRLKSKESSDVEIWRVQTESKKLKLLTQIPSCQSIVLDFKGKNIFYQEELGASLNESLIGRVSTGGGKPKIISKGLRLTGIINSGKYMGNLIVYRKKRHHLGIAMEDCPYLVGPKGQEVGRIRGGPCE